MVMLEKRRKTFHTREDKRTLLMRFRDEIHIEGTDDYEFIEGKGNLCWEINKNIHFALEKGSFSYKKHNHFIEFIPPNEVIIKKLDLIPLEVVVRQTVTGSIMKRTGLEEGLDLRKPVVELWYRREDLNYPLLNDEHVLAMGLVEPSELITIKNRSMEAYDALRRMFKSHDAKLVDIRFMFGRYEDNILFGDELSPDICRAWKYVNGLASKEHQLDRQIYRDTRDLKKTIEGYKLFLEITKEF